MKIDNVKRRIIGLMRAEDLTCLDAAYVLGVSKARVVAWLKNDKEFGRAVENVWLVREIDFVLAVDGMVRAMVKSGRKRLNADELELVNLARCFENFILETKTGKATVNSGSHLPAKGYVCANGRRGSFEEAVLAALARARVFAARWTKAKKNGNVL
jgi:predicted transcriptional regulator